MKFKHRVERIYKFEYWSFWIFYFPFVLQWLYYSIRSLSFVYFTRANYNTPFGAFFQYSKFQFTNQISKEYLPTTYLFNSKSELRNNLAIHIFNNRFIYKPDFGERGKGISLYYKEDFIKVIDTLNYPCQIQEYINLPIELGILFYKLPSGKKGITSIVRKDFLTITGNGESSLGDLILNEVRASNRIDYLKSKFSKIWNSILKLNESIVLEEIGNHNRGTTFLNSNNIICDELVEVINKITSPISGFHYGRLDLKCETIEKLIKGKNIKIIEVNGVASEAGHIYDPKMSLFKAYKDVYKNNQIVFKISQELKKQGKKTPNTLFEFINAWFENRKNS